MHMAHYVCWCLQRDVLISAVADDQLKEHGVIAVTFASPKETPVSAGALAQLFQWLQLLRSLLARFKLSAGASPRVTTGLQVPFAAHLLLLL